MTTDRHDPAAGPEPLNEFWGEQAEWTTQRQPTIASGGLVATIRRWWDGVLGAGAVAERAHGRAVERPSSGDDPNRPVQRSPIADPHQDHADDDLGDDAWTLEPEPQPNRHQGVDPLLARLGGLAVIVTLAAPLVVGFTASGSDAQPSDSLLATISSAPSPEIADPTTTAVPGAPTWVATTGPAASTPDSTAGASFASAASDDGDAEPEASAPISAVAAALLATPEPEPATTAPAVTTPPCGGRYELETGDYWIRIADAAGVSLAELLAANESSVDTVLVPGRSICLPVGAATPSPPAAAAATTISSDAPAPAPTAPATTVVPIRPSTTLAPAPTTTAPIRPAAVPHWEAVAIIRDVWPDDLEERALEIAWRESNHRSNVNNHCCYGLFQIHWNAHRSWLSTIGVTSVSQLFDPRVNANAAYMLHQRSGGFGPWGG